MDNNWLFLKWGYHYIRPENIISFYVEKRNDNKGSFNYAACLEKKNGNILFIVFDSLHKAEECIESFIENNKGF